MFTIASSELCEIVNLSYINFIQMIIEMWASLIAN